MVRDHVDKCRLRSYLSDDVSGSCGKQVHCIHSDYYCLRLQIAGLASVVGILVLATPISMVVEKFADAQERLEAQQEREGERTGARGEGLLQYVFNRQSSTRSGASKLRKVFAGKFGAVRRIKQRRKEEEAKAANNSTSTV